MIETGKFDFMEEYYNFLFVYQAAMLYINECIRIKDSSVIVIQYGFKECQSREL